MTTTTMENMLARQRIWEGMLNGSISLEEGRAAQIRLGWSETIADALVNAAREQRQAGVASGATWAQTPAQQPPVQQSGLLSEHAKQVLARADQSTPDKVGYVPPTRQDVVGLGEDDPFASFLRRFNLPGYGGSTVQNWQRQQFQPQFSTFQAESALSPAGTNPTPWSDWMQSGQDNPQAVRQRAGQLFQQARGGNQADFQESFEREGDFENFIQAALQGRYAAPVAKAMSRWIPGLQRQYQAESTGRGTNLLDYLNQRLRLG